MHHLGTVQLADDGERPQRVVADTRATEGNGGIYSTGDDMALWLHHNLADNEPPVWQTLALAHVVYREREAMTAASGFDEAGIMDGLAPLQLSKHQDLQSQSH